MVGGLADGVLVVVVHPLAIVMLSAREDLADIAGLHGIVAVLVHQVVGRVDVTFVIPYRRGGLVVHHKLHALRVGIFIKSLDVEIGVRGDEVIDKVL